MSKQSRVPDPETATRLLTNLRRTHLEMKQFNLEIAEINAKLEEANRQKHLLRLEQSLNNY